MRLLDVHDAGDGQIALGVHGAHAAERGRRHRGAVVGVAAADHGFALRLLEQIPVAPHQPQVGVVGLGAGAGIKHMLEAAPGHRRRQLGQARRQPHRGLVRGLEKAVVVGQLEHLRVCGIGQLAPPVADVDAPQPAHGVQQPLALAVPDVDALAVGDHARALGRQRLVVGEGVQVVRGIERLQLGGQGGGGHGGSRLRALSRGWEAIGRV